MQMEMLPVKGAPSLYLCEEGVLDRLEELLGNYGFTRGVVIHGEKSWKCAQPYFPKFRKIALDFVPYRGNCSTSEINRISEICRNAGAEFVIGVGGGKISDLTKAVADQLKIDPVNIPTLPSTSAPWTALSIVYTDDKVYERTIFYLKSPLMVLLEPRMLLDSPLIYMRAGIGDTLAKWYESEIINRNKPNLRIPIRFALGTSKVIRDTLLANSAEAIRSFERKELTPELISIFEVIVMCGAVSGFGSENTRVAAAHAVHNGLTRLEQTKRFIHGEIVAYGILVQLALEQNWDEIESLIGFYREIGLPCSLKELGIDAANDGELRTVAEGTLAPGESIYYIDRKFTQEDLITAMRDLETFSLKKIS